MNERSAIPKTVFWLTIAAISILDILLLVGLKTLIRLFEAVTALEWLSPWLGLLTTITPLPTAVATIFDLLLIGAICYVTVVAVARNTELIATPISPQQVVNLSAFLFVLYLLFALPYGALYVLTSELTYTQSRGLYFSLLSVAFVTPLLVSYLRGMHIAPETASGITIQTNGSLVGAAYLFAGGLALLSSLELAIGILTLLIALYRLTVNTREFTLSPEQRLMQAVSIVNRNPLGFPILYSLTTGLYLVTELYLRATPADLLMLAWLKSWQLYPVTNLVILGISVVGGGIATALAVVYLRAPAVSISSRTLTILLGVSLWFLVGVIFGWEWVRGDITTVLTPTAAIVYPVIIASGVVIVEVLNQRGISRSQYRLIVSGFILAISPLVLPQELPSQTVFIELALVGYWGSPAAEWIGQTVIANTSV